MINSFFYWKEIWWQIRAQMTSIVSQSSIPNPLYSPAAVCANNDRRSLWWRSIYKQTKGRSLKLCGLQTSPFIMSTLTARVLNIRNNMREFCLSNELWPWVGWIRKILSRNFSWEAKSWWRFEIFIGRRHLTVWSKPQTPSGLSWTPSKQENLSSLGLDFCL